MAAPPIVRSMRVAAIQHDIVWCDPAANFERLAPMIDRAAAAGAGLVLLSETYSTGFATDRDDIGEPVGGPSGTFLAETATRGGIWIGGTFPETTDGDPRPHNTFLLAAPDGRQFRYRKIHTFGFGGEDRHFRAGDEFVTVDIDGLRVSLFTCYDLRFADEFWVRAAETDVYLVPANWPAARRHHWQTLVRARAIENQAYVVACNRVGSGGGLDYAGDTMVVDPTGEVATSGAGQETIVLADVDAERVAEVRSSFPFLDDRR